MTDKNNDIKRNASTTSIKISEEKNGKIDLQIGVKTSFFYRLIRHVSGKLSRVDIDVVEPSAPDFAKKEGAEVLAVEAADGPVNSGQGCSQSFRNLSKSMKAKILGSDTLNPTKDFYFNWLRIRVENDAIKRNFVLSLFRLIDRLNEKLKNLQVSG